MPTQRFLDEDVVTAARRRIAFAFDHFDDIVVSVSGGKDSTVLAHLACSEAQRRGRKVKVFFLDEEVVYQSTVNQVEAIISHESVVPAWFQMEFRLTNSTSTTEGQLVCWEPSKSKLWMRRKRPGAIKHGPWDHAAQTVRDKNKGFGFYDAIENYQRANPGAAFLVGLRADGESINRRRAVTKNPVAIGGKQIYWATKRENTTTLYPIYDWDFHDVWKYIDEHKLPYSKIYDMMFKKGYPLGHMRVSSLIHERAFKSICDLPEFEPRTYQRLLKRVKGIALAQETGKSAKLFACRKLPKNFKSWIAYRDFLMQTHPDRERLPIFQRRFARHLENEYVARQQCRQLLLNDYENNLPIDNIEDPREALVRYYDEVL